MPHDWHCLLSIWKLQYYKTYFHSFIKKLSDLFRSYAKVVNGDRPWQGCPTVRAKKSHPSGVFFRPKPCMGGSGPVHGPCLRNGTKSNKTSKKVYWFFCSIESKKHLLWKRKRSWGGSYWFSLCRCASITGSRCCTCSAGCFWELVSSALFWDSSGDGAVWFWASPSFIFCSVTLNRHSHAEHRPI